MNTIRKAAAIGSLAVLATACVGGTSSIRVSPTSTTIGRLVGGYGGDPALDGGALPAFIDGVRVIPCAQYRQVTGHDPYYLMAPPLQAGRPLCFVDPATAASPATAGGVMYIPAGQTRAGLPQIWSAGGILVADNWTPGVAGQFGPSGPERNPDGTRHWVETRLAGRAAYVVAIPNLPRIEVIWTEQRPPGGVSLLEVQGTYSPDRMAKAANSIAEGLPPNELVVSATVERP